LLWDHAAWHRSQAVRHWLRQHQQPVNPGAEGVHIVVCPVPSNSPWLNPLAPKGGHGTRAVSEPDRLLRAAELDVRVDTDDGCERAEHLVMPKKVA